MPRYVQATVQPISTTYKKTQTDSSIKCDFQAQADIPRENESIAVQTIEEEIDMPNLPSSTKVYQTPAKKRKMSSADLDDEILNSEVYKIYCQNEDPKEAMKQIKEMDTCLGFRQPKKPFPAEEDFKRACKKTLKKLWEMEPRLRDSKFTKIKKYIDENKTKYALHQLDSEMNEMINDCFTIIRMLIPNGYEFWYVGNFEKGKSASSWFRVESSKEDSTRYLAELNVMGITRATIDKYQRRRHWKKKMIWFDFAYDAVLGNLYEIFRTKSSVNIKFRVVTGSYLVLSKIISSI